MSSTQNISNAVKTAVTEMLPDAQVMLFGSRARGDWNDESGWDILILTHNLVSKQLKRDIQTKIFPLSVKAGSFINLLIVQEQDWLQNPGYYTLRQKISGETIPV